MRGGIVEGSRSPGYSGVARERLGRIINWIFFSLFFLSPVSVALVAGREGHRRTRTLVPCLSSGILTAAATIPPDAKLRRLRLRLRLRPSSAAGVEGDRADVTALRELRATQCSCLAWLCAYVLVISLKERS